MMIHCVACDSKFHLGKGKIKAVGSKVRCSKCHESFIVFPPDRDTEFGSKNSSSNTNAAVVIPRAKRSLLDDLFDVESNPTEMATSAGKIKSTDVSSIGHIEPEEDFDKRIEDADDAELPDLSEIEEIVDSILDERDHLNDISPYIQAKYVLTRDLNCSGE